MNNIINNDIIGFHTTKDYLDVYNCPLQFFVGPPFSYEVTSFLNLDLSDKKIFIHSKYVGNIAKHDSRVTVRYLKKELEYLQNLKIQNTGSVFHLTTGHDINKEQSLIYISTVLNKFCKELDFKLNNEYYNHIIIETSNHITHLGSTIEDFKIIYDNLNTIARKRVRFCIDTSHIFVTYYGINTVDGMIDYLSNFDLLVGLDKIILIHLNDSKGLPLSSFMPHEAIGKGNIFNEYKNKLSSLHILKAFACIYNLPCILERRGVTEPVPDEIINEMEIYTNLDINDLNTNQFMAMINKKKIIIMLSKLQDTYKILANIKETAYRKAIESINNSDIIILKYKIKNKIPMLMEKKKNVIDKYKNINNIGDSIANKIYEIITTNKIQKLYIIENDEKFKAIKQLTELLYIGPKKASELYRQGIKTISDLTDNISILQDKNILTTNQINSITYLQSLKPLSNEFIKKVESNIVLPSNYEWFILGSYARKSKFSKDIDILIIDFDIKIMIDNLKKKYNLLSIFRNGDKIFSGIFKNNQIIFRVEIYRVDKDSKYAAILHYTGSKSFNIILRNIAREHNMLLNQYGLYKNGIKLQLESTNDIFRYLDIAYVPPEKRNL
ncbi:putative DNA polymerase beta/AP endonuclease [Alphaentomopoxvirus acuprea]|uniref:Probable AP endonuclease n=1 Tax=Alphaentomopoxvirus acuprea TaxID=62099 RepID=W6JJ15_9POXV|nr:putative DNA polymerase beta/AP endonuclease [Anomala cuprea entomopoxvirus]BAO49572.1 putative DNA polymerase beta/AP endonuclease [Anomala cuprea entomopoxvirus]